MFTYAELDTYVEVINEVKRHVDEVEYTMSGAFPDNSQSCDMEVALQHAELLLANAEALRNEIKALMHSEVKPPEWTTPDDFDGPEDFNRAYQDWEDNHNQGPWARGYTID